jgi:UDP-2-acetamido-2,6-beta-L-arabino-hexul-4-ose reductase
MLKIGITGQSGFVGNHLYNKIGTLPEEFVRVPFEKDFFLDQNKLIVFVSKCDVIVHLAAMNRHQDEQVLNATNVDLVNKLIQALKSSNSKAHILFSSSSQEFNNNLYGESKRIGRELLIDWAKQSGGKFTGLIIPNVFGPFGVPFYNSFIATFSYQLTHNEHPKINLDASVKLIYIDELLDEIISQIKKGISNYNFIVPFSEERKVSNVLELLLNYKNQYLDNGIIPDINDQFELNLFNTFRSYINMESHFPVKFIQHKDDRGAFVEVVRLNIGGQVSFSTTLPGVTRGNHYHTRKIERFAVIKGKALIQMRKIGTQKVLNFYLDGDNPAYVDMPIWHTHNIKNIGEDTLYTIFWINEPYDPDDPDTWFEVV